MDTKDAQDVGIELSDIERTVKIWAHEIIEELEDGLAAEEHSQHCIKAVPPARKEDKELVVA